MTAHPLAPVIPFSGVPASKQRARPAAARRLPLARPVPVPSSAGAGGVGQRGHVVDRGRDAEGASDGCCVPKAVIVVRGEGEADADAVSPLARRAVRNAASWAGWWASSMTSVIAQRVSSAVRSSRASMEPRSAGGGWPPEVRELSAGAWPGRDRHTVAKRGIGHDAELHVHHVVGEAAAVEPCVAECGPGT